MTEIAYHPTHVRALRETFKALRTAEFPWTAETIYLRLDRADPGTDPPRARRIHRQTYCPAPAARS